MLSFFANPLRFMKLSGALLWPVLIVGLGLSAWGIWQGLFVVPPDFRQSDAARIMYVHVPAAWVSLGVYVGMVVASFVSLVWRHVLADVAARSAALAGTVFTVICLVTGAIWGKPMWGAYWAWDPRLTAMLIQLLIYLGYLGLWAAIEDPQKAGRAAAILCLVGAVNIPIIRFSVEWTSSLHQGPSVIREGGPAMEAVYLMPLLVTGLGFLLLSVAATLAAMRAEILNRQAEAVLNRAHRAAFS
jgi:heme exporter protein C